MLALYSTLAQVSAAAPTDSPSTSSVVIVGFLFVIIVLALLATVTSAIGAFFVKQAASEAAKAALAAQKAAEFSQGSSGQGPIAPAPGVAGIAPSTDPYCDDPAILAVIAAAIHSVIGDRPHRIVSIRSTGPGWAQEGRRQIFSSHRVR